MGSRRDAKTQRGKKGCLGLVVLVSLRLERSGREHSIFAIVGIRSGFRPQFGGLLGLG